MKNRSYFAVLVYVFLIILISSCKPSEAVNESTDYTLTVSLSTGIDGSPTNGTFTYTKDHLINFNYSLKSGYSNLQVKLDGTVVNSSGTFTMNTNHTLEVTADAGGSYSLTVNVGSGVTGTPATGSYSYSNNNTVNYNYNLENNNYTNLQVKLDGVGVNSSGSITMNNNHTLTATSTSNSATYDVSGDWIGTMRDSNGDDDLFVVTFTAGSASSGTTSGYTVDNSSIGTGTYNVNGSSIDFTLLYGNGARHFSITGTLSDQSNMSGTWIWTTTDGQWTGTFTLVKQ